MNSVKCNIKVSKSDSGVDRSDHTIVETDDAGFSLIETMMALIVIMIALLGVFAVFTYAIIYNEGNRSRSHALAVLQQEAELIRSAKFNSSTTDAILLGGTQAPRTVTYAPSNRTYTVNISVDDDPLTAGVQVEATDPCLSPQGTAIDCTLKEITIEVRLAAPSPGWQWQTADAIRTRMVLRRVRGN